MTISDQLRLIRDGVKQWAANQKGDAFIALSMLDLVQVLGTKPGGFRCAVHFVSETKRGDFEEAGMVDRQYWIGLSWGKSQQLSTGEIMVKGDTGGRPMGEVAGELRQVLRGLVFDPATTERTADYKGMWPLQNVSQDFLLDGLYLEITIGTVLPPPNP